VDVDEGMDCPEVTSAEETGDMADEEPYLLTAPSLGTSPALSELMERVRQARPEDAGSGDESEIGKPPPYSISQCRNQADIQISASHLSRPLLKVESCHLILAYSVNHDHQIHFIYRQGNAPLLLDLAHSMMSMDSTIPRILMMKNGTVHSNQRRFENSPSQATSTVSVNDNAKAKVRSYFGLTRIL
jgi:hypothetical protein